MTKSTITREQLTEELKRRIYVTERYPDLETAQIDAIICKLALAAMDSEPVAWTWQHREHWHVTNCEGHARELAWDGVKVEPLYRHAQPAPVAQDERAAFNAWNNEDNLPIAGVSAKNAAWLAWQARASLCGNSVLDVPHERHADSSNGDDVETWFDEGWNACRAAMLQAEPVTTANKLGNSPVIPDTWIPVSERLPEPYEPVNFYTPDNIENDVSGSVYNGHWDGDFWHQDATLTGYDCSPILRNIVVVTHWMPLPNPPKEEK